MLAASMRTRTSSAPGVGTGTSSRTSPGSEPRFRTARIVSTARRSCHAAPAGPHETASSASLSSPSDRLLARAGAAGAAATVRRFRPALERGGDSEDTCRRVREDDDRRASGLELESRAVVEEKRRHAAHARPLGEQCRASASSYRPRFRRHAGQTWISAGGAHPASSCADAVPVDEGDELGGVVSTEDRGEREAVDALAGVEQRPGCATRSASCAPPADGEPSSASPRASSATDARPQAHAFSDPPGGAG